MGRAASRAAAMHQMSAMRAPWPTTGTALSIPQTFATPIDALAPGFHFLGGLDPTDPLVASQWRNVLPGRQRVPIEVQGVFQILRKDVDNAFGDDFLVSRL